MQNTKSDLHLVDINVLIAQSQATIRCTANGQIFNETGPLERVLGNWQKFMDQLPPESREVAESAMRFAEAGRQ